MTTKVTFHIELEDELFKEECDELLLTVAAQLERLESLKNAWWKARVVTVDYSGTEHRVGILYGK